MRRRVEIDDEAKAEARHAFNWYAASNPTVASAFEEELSNGIEILREEGFQDLYVDINSIGDKDSIGHFTRDVNQFFRSHAGELPAHCRTQVKKDLFSAIECDDPKYSESETRTLLEEAGSRHIEVVED